MLNYLHQLVFFKTIKSQISSTKLQINLKLQYSMTKTFITVLLHRFANPGPPVMMLLSTSVISLYIWNFEFGSLGFVWDLVFGA
jgi:uncharacterized membrane protein